ncbi:MAG: Fic family protein [Elusimicrobia bacterium]|nr:Fic family protein [Elusimicrobiota bacterium]
MRKNRFEKRLENLPQDILVKIAQIDELKGQWISGAQLGPQVLGRLKKSVLVTSTGASTRIEGASLSDQDIEKLMRGLSIQKFTDRDKQEVRGYYELLQNVFEAWQTIPFSEGSIKHFHKELLKFVEKDKLHRGDYKKSENKVEMISAEGKVRATIFDPTPAYLTPNEMQELVEWTRSTLTDRKYHPLLVIGNFIVEFLAIHPFQDGNGRMSRILTNLLMLRSGYLHVPYVSHEKFVEDNKSDYYIALRRSQKTFKTYKEDVYPWLTFFLDVLLRQSKMAADLLSAEALDKLLSGKQLIVWSYIQSVKETTPREIIRATKVPRPTVNQVLYRLLVLKKIERLGLGRSTRYKKV